MKEYGLELIHIVTQMARESETSWVLREKRKQILGEELTVSSTQLIRQRSPGRVKHWLLMLVSGTRFC